MTNICIFGNSITWGAYDFDKGGWVERLKTHLFEQKKYYELYNLGVSGDTTKNILKRFEIECQARKPETIIFSVGINDTIKDANKKYWVKIDDFENNIKKLIILAKKHSKKIIFLGYMSVDEKITNPVCWDEDIFWDNKTIKLYDLKLKKICEKNKILYIYMFDILDKKDFHDGVHPNSKGHEKIFKKIIKEITF